MTNISSYFEQAELAFAAYSDLTKNMLSTPYKNKLVSVGMTEAQADHFASTWRVVDQYNDPLTGLSATVFQKADGTTCLAIRGTDGTMDVLADYLIYQGLPSEISPQYLSLKAQVQTWLADPEVLQGKNFTVTGHSLGGYLAAGLLADFPASISHAYLYNSPGMNSDLSEYAQALGFANMPDPAKISNLRANSGIGLSPVASLGEDFSPPISIAIEDQFLSDISNPPSARNHSMRVLTEALALYAAYAQVDPSASIDTITRIIRWSSNRNGNTLELGLDNLRELFLGATVSATVQEDREGYYTNLYQLTKVLDDRNVAGEPTLKLYALDRIGATNALKALSTTPDGLAYRYALSELKPFAVTGDASLYASYNAAGELTNLTEQYLNDRAQMLQWKMVIDLFGDDYSERRDVQLTHSGDYIYQDVASGLTLDINGFNPTTLASHFIKFGDTGNDSLVGGALEDRLFGGGGDDTLHGGDGRDVIEGNAGSDSLHGDAGSDYLYGQQGNDSLTGGTGNDVLDGGENDDRYDYRTGDGNDIINDATGSNTLVINGQSLGALTRTSVESKTYKDDHGNSYALTDAGALVISVWDNLHASGTLTLNKFNQASNNFGLVLNDPPDLAQPVQGSAIYAVGNGSIINADNKLEAIYSSLSARESDADQAFINTMAIQFDAALATELWTYDGASVNGYAFQGGHQNDRLLGGQFRDWLDGKDGDDYIDAGLGAYVNDPTLGGNFVRGGLGSDYLLGGADTDFMSGNDYNKWALWDRANPQLTAGYLDESAESKDYINGGGGNDRLSGDEGDDEVLGGTGDDDLLGGAGKDTLVGGSGIDFIMGDSRMEIFFANGEYEAGKDWIYSKETPTHYDDILDGGQGLDNLLGEIGDDLVIGGEGNDYIWGDRPETAEELFANPTTQEIAAYIALTADLHGNDTLLGEAGADTLYGNGGDDFLDGGLGADVLRGDDDKLAGQYHGKDTLIGGDDNSADILIGGGNDDYLEGGDGNDFLVGDATRNEGETSIALSGQYHGNDLLYGGAGNDTLEGGGKADILHGGDGDDQLWGDSQYDDDGIQYTTPWLDEIYHGNDTLYGEAGNDFIHAGAGDDTVFGGEGHDVIYGSNGDDTLFGGEGDDEINGDEGNDNLFGGSGTDSIYGGAGNDILDGGIGDADFLIGGAGNDTYRIYANQHTTIKDTEGSSTLEIIGDVDISKMRVAVGTQYTQIFFASDGKGIINMDNATFAALTSLTLANNTTVAVSDIQRIITRTISPNTVSYFDISKASGGQLVIQVDENYPVEKVVFQSSGPTLQLDIHFGSGYNSTYYINDYYSLLNTYQETGQPIVGVLVSYYGNSSKGFQIKNSYNLVGTESDDVIIGTLVSDVLNGYGGNDSINGNGGADTIIGGRGDDAIETSDYFSDGSNFIFNKGDGHDTIDGHWVDKTAEGYSLSFTGGGELKLSQVYDPDPYYYHYTSDSDWRMVFEYGDADTVSASSEIMRDLSDITLDSVSIDKLTVSDKSPLGGNIWFSKNADIDVTIDALMLSAATELSGDSYISIKTGKGDDHVRLVVGSPWELGTHASIETGSGNDVIDLSAVTFQKSGRRSGPSIYVGAGNKTIFLNADADAHIFHNSLYGGENPNVVGTNYSIIMTDVVASDLLMANGFYSVVGQRKYTDPYTTLNPYTRFELWSDFTKLRWENLGEVTGSNSIILSGAGDAISTGGRVFSMELLDNDDFEVVFADGEVWSKEKFTAFADETSGLLRVAGPAPFYTTVDISAGLTIPVSTLRFNNGESVGALYDVFWEPYYDRYVSYDKASASINVAANTPFQVLDLWFRTQNSAGIISPYAALTIDDSGLNTRNITEVVDNSGSPETSTFTGTRKNDIISPTSARYSNSIIYGEEGDDVFYGGANAVRSAVSYYGGLGNDFIFLGLGGWSINYKRGDGQDTIDTHVYDVLHLGLYPEVWAAPRYTGGQIIITGYTQNDATLTLTDNSNLSIVFSPTESITILGYFLETEDKVRGYYTPITFKDAVTQETTAVLGYDYVASLLSVQSIQVKPDFFEITEDGSGTLSFTEILSNDSNSNGQVLNIENFKDIKHGSLSENWVTGSIEFTPDKNFFGMASVTYVVSNGNISEEGKIDIAVSPVADLVVAYADNFSLFTGQDLLITARDLTRNDANPDLYPLSVSDVSGGNVSEGSVFFDEAAQTIYFTPAADFIGKTSFTYHVSNGLSDSAGMVTISISESVINGTSGADNLVGTTGNDTLNGFAGADTLNGGLGADKLVGGTEDDIYVVDNVGDRVIENANEGTDTVQSSISYTLTANVEKLVLTTTSTINGTGNALDNVLTGNSAVNTLTGGAGNDRLDGQAGADTMIGGTGDDIYVIDDLGDIVTENANEGTDTIESSVTLTLGANVENLTLTGTATINGTGNTLNNILIGNSAANTLLGDAGNDRLDGQAGTDTLLGGAGDDTYVVDISTDVITENANEGTDTIESSVTLTLGNNVENLLLTGTAAINGTGNTLDNVLIGNSANNTLTGGAGNDRLDGGTGNDTMLGGAGNDTYVVNVSTDIVTENASEGTDTVESSVTLTLATNVENLTLTGTSAINGTGNTLNNVLIGNSVANTLSGGTGTDTLIGGAGDDIYVVDNAGDIVTENLNEGTDLVQSSVTTTLSANVENLLLTGTSTINGTGNALDNVLTGNAAKNILTGAAGNDRLDGKSGADTMVGGTGDDTYVFNVATDIATENVNEGTDTIESIVTLTLAANVENLLLTGTSTINGTGNALDNVLTGNGAVNTLTGGAGNDRLDGKAGADKMLGGTGNDTYVVDISTDVITENANEGSDTVESSLTLTLGANVENLVLTGTTAINGTGNALDNVLKGNDAVNSLSGGAGNDTLGGMGGADTLTGGTGNDTYVLGRAYGADTVIENDATAGNTDIAQFLSGVAADQIWFQKVGNNLETSIIGTSDKLVAKDWYLGTAYHVEQFKTTDGSKTLLDSNVENLINAMASFAPPAAGQTTLPTDYQTALSPVIAANWQ